ncbi:MAG: acetyl-CoA carboxylase carboxyltransferase subunit alpha [Candidatus Dadabacteria bacterium]|nr:MAG: acetyl-CoA carboxylase carboxyltransferase subunit alpha [Candidatus Dadabacteria bacterium]
MALLKHPLEFERPLVELEEELEALRNEIEAGNSDRREEYARLEERVNKLRRDIYSNLTVYQKVQLSRHFDRPCTLDFINYMCRNFIEFHGDRLFRDDPAIVGGTAMLGSVSVVIVGHQRGRGTSERLKRNFGMANPEGYRKALRLFKMAEKFSLPIVTLIDTQGAYPGMEAEMHGQAEAIARNLIELAAIKTPVVAAIIGEGGSGGALALGVADRVLMLENACYSVITPEGCASILWHKGDDEPPQKQAAYAAEMLKGTAQDLKAFGVIDEVVPEPLGGAHRNYKEAAERLQAVLLRHLDELIPKPVDELIKERYDKFRKMGPFTE